MHAIQACGEGSAGLERPQDSKRPHVNAGGRAAKAVGNRGLLQELERLSQNGIYPQSINAGIEL